MQTSGALLLDATTEGGLDASSLSATSTSLLAAVTSAIDRRLANCRSAIAESLGAREGGADTLKLDRGLELLVNKCMRLQRVAVVRVDTVLVEVLWPLHIYFEVPLVLLVLLLDNDQKV
jgi:hypothetical protein